MKKFFSRHNVAKALVASLLVALIPNLASASQITSRKLTLSTSSPTAGAAVTYTFNFTVPTTGTIVQSWEAQICTAASGTCTTPGGFTNSSSITQPTGLGDTTGWTGNTATAGSLRMSKSGNATNPSGSQTVIFNNVTNPTTANQAFYARITTYSGAAWTGVIDTGTVAASTASEITVTGTMDESLVFCTGTSITGQNCGTISGTSVGLGTFSTTSAVHATSVMAASTNAANGYAITVTGTTLTCSVCSGSPTIAAMGTQSANGAATTSSPGSAQFGFNLRSNTSLGGADVSGTGTGTYGTNYGTVDNFRFFSGDTVATASGSTNANAFTVDYIANVPGSQAAGSYSTTLTYICTATF